MCVIVRDAMTTVAYPNKFVRRVREEMTAQKLSVRGLARRMDPDNVERARRNLHRWLDEGIAPGRASRSEVASALQIQESELADDDEEADPAMRDAFRLFVDLMDQVVEAREKKNARKRREREEVEA